MKVIKKLISMVLIGVIVLSVGGCSDSQNTLKTDVGEESLEDDVKVNNYINNNDYLKSDVESTNPENDDKDEDNVSVENNKISGIRNETLKGRGSADEGRNEPDYVGKIGYAVVSYEFDIYDESVINLNWEIPTYIQDNQFWEEKGTVSHKTEVLVKQQLLEHKGYGAYSGYLLVVDISTEEEFYINVTNFITKPYWLYKDLLKIAGYGEFIAEFNQLSSYYPVNSSGNKLELEDGTLVLIDSKTGLQRNVDYNTNQVNGIVISGSNKGSRAFINTNDLSIVY